MSVILVPVYVAGPDVFFPNAAANAEVMRSLCEKHGVKALIPLDNEVSESDKVTMSTEIFVKNVQLINQARMTIANMTPFRGPSADAGTIWEIGYTYAQGKPVFAHTLDLREYKDRVTVQDGNAIEDFGNVDNLMIDKSIVQISGDLEAVLTSEAFKQHLFLIRKQMVEESKTQHVDLEYSKPEIKPVVEVVNKPSSKKLKP